MKQITVTINIDEDVIRNETKDTGATTLDEAISQELEWLHDSGMYIEAWSYTEPEKGITQQLSAEENSELCNTKILYLYRDADNYKMMNECVIEGLLSKEQLHTILDCLENGEYFIPSQVCLPEKRFGEITESDHCWFELNAYSFLTTPDAPTVKLNVETLVQMFCDRKNRWDDTVSLAAEPSRSITYDMAKKDILLYLLMQPENYFSERERDKAQVLQNNSFIDTLAYEHMKNVNELGVERKESYCQICDGTNCLDFKRETAKLSLSDQIHSGTKRSMNSHSEINIPLKNPDKER